MNTVAEFWKNLAKASAKASCGDRVLAQLAIESAYRQARALEDCQSERRLKIVDELASVYELEFSRGAVSEGEATRPDGVSLVTSCRNRNDNLFLALPSWLECPEVSEVVIVDWSSTERVSAGLTANDLHDPRIKVLRVEDEPRWILSYAFNLGFRSALFDKILKVDADIVVDPEFFQKNVLKRQNFIAGNWRSASQGQAFVNGFFYAWTDDILGRGGFNEYITTYGWDDEELYARLMSYGTRRTDVAPDTIYHLPHDDTARVEQQPKTSKKVAADTLSNDTTFLIRRNRMIANLMPEWNPSSPSVHFETQPVADREVDFRRIDRSVNRVPTAIQEEAFYSAARELLAWKLGDECYGLGLDRVKELIENFKWDDLTLDLVKGASGGTATEREAPSEHAGPPSHHEAVAIPLPLIGRRRQDKIFVDAQHGLGNRLRAIGSAAAIAASSDRELIVVWEPDQHCQCRLTDLFNYSGALIHKAFLQEAERSGMQVYNYMETEEGAIKSASIELQGKTDIYLRSAYVFNHSSSDWTAENEFIRRLAPTEQVLELTRRISQPFDLSVHVRMQGGPGYEHLPWEAAENWSAEGHQAVAEWRARSHYTRFFRRIEQLVEQGEVSSIFVATDLISTYDEFQKAFGKRVQFLEREVDDRSEIQLKYALADAILLSKAPKMLGSNWSSFSELAMRLANSPSAVEMSGVDF